MMMTTMGTLGVFLFSLAPSVHLSLVYLGHTGRPRYQCEFNSVDLSTDIGTLARSSATLRVRGS